MYTREGIRGYVDPKRVIPWDEVRRVRIDGKPVMRHVLTIRPEHGHFMARGLGGVKRSDVGRVLVADLYPNGHWIDAFALPGQQVLPKRHGDAGGSGPGMYLVERRTGRLAASISRRRPSASSPWRPTRAAPSCCTTT